MAHRSDSAVQLEAEAAIREKLAVLLGKPLAPATITFDSGAQCRSTASPPTSRCWFEIFARRGKLKPGQQKKVALDASSSSRSRAAAPARS